MQREADHQVDDREHDEGLPPAHLFLERMADHPEHRRGERPEQREIGDGLPAARGRDLHERGEGRIVQTQPHPDAQERPDHEVGRFAADLRQREEPGGHEDGAERHHRARATAVDGTADGRRHEAHRQHRHGEAEEDEAAAPSRVPPDRPCEDSEAVVAGPPGGDLRDAQREDRADHGVAESRVPAGAVVPG